MKLNDNDKKYLLSLKPEEMKSDAEVNALLTDLFGTKTKKDENGNVIILKPRFDPTDEFILNPGECNENKEKVRTTAGQLMFNKYLFGNGLYKIVGYIARTLNSKEVGKIEDILSENNLLIYEHLNDEEMTDTYFNKYNTLNPNNQIVAPKGVCYCLAVKK